MLHNTQVRTANGVLYQCTVHEVPTEEEELSLTRPIGRQFANPGGEGLLGILGGGVQPGSPNSDPNSEQKM